MAPTRSGASIPIVATVTADGLRAGAPTTRWPSASPRLDRAAWLGAGIGGDGRMSMPFYVAPEQVMKDRAEYAQKGIARGRSLVAVRLRRRHPDRGREPVAVAPQDQRDLRPDRLRRGRQVQRVRPAARGRGPARRHEGLRVQPRGRRRPFAGQRLRPVPRPGVHPRDEAARGRDPRRRARRRRRADQLYHIAYDGTSSTRTASRCSAARPRSIAERLEEPMRDGTGRSTTPCARRWRALAGPGPDPRRRRPRGGRARPRQRAAGLPPHRARRARRAPRAAPRRTAPASQAPGGGRSPSSGRGADGGPLRSERAPGTSTCGVSASGASSNTASTWSTSSSSARVVGLVGVDEHRRRARAAG